MRMPRRAAIAAAALGVVMSIVVASPAAAGALPWGASLSQGQELPPPFGIGVTLYSQNQPYRVDSLSFSLPGFTTIPASLLKIDNRIAEANVQLDAWLFPFLDVFGLVGKIDGSTRVDFRQLALPLPFSGITVGYHGNVYGAGATLVAGGEHWFASLTGVKTKADLSGDFDSRVNATVVMPRLGIGNAKTSYWIGAMYQRTDENHKGTIVLPYLGPAAFAVALSQKSDWSGLVGAHAALGKAWTLELEGGFGNRTSASLTLAYRL